MLKPVTTEERLGFTLSIQADKGTSELLCTLLYDEKYHGFVDIWPNITVDRKRTITEDKSRVELTIQYKKVLLATSPKSHPDAARFHVVPDKGVKLIK